MKKLKKWVFKAWRDCFSEKTSIALCYGRWFEMALNCCRDGDMGSLDEEGYYERLWATDEIYSDAEFVRNATEWEVEAYLKRVGIAYFEPGETEVAAIVIDPDESYVLIELKDQPLFDNINI